MDEVEIVRKQVVEDLQQDLQLHRSKPWPLLIVDVCESSLLAVIDLPLSQSTRHFEVAVNSPAQVCKKSDTKIYKHQAVTAINWNSTPLEGWLGEYNTPSSPPIFECECEEDVLMMEHSVAQEMEEIKIFRNVHMSMSPEPDTDTSDVTAIDRVADLDLDTQMYYRNIVDSISAANASHGLAVCKRTCIVTLKRSVSGISLSTSLLSLNH